jgi:2-amino-3-ketobutyrate coenzyme A ligase (EC 2.3.1.29)
MYPKAFQKQLQEGLNELREQGLYKTERIITSKQDAQITLDSGQEVLNFCANNYLGLSSHPEVVQAAKDTLDSHGFGMSSVRFICGTQDIHKQLEAEIASFYGTEDSFFMQQLSTLTEAYLSLF